MRGRYKALGAFLAEECKAALVASIDSGNLEFELGDCLDPEEPAADGLERVALESGGEAPELARAEVPVRYEVVHPS